MWPLRFLRLVREHLAELTSEGGSLYNQMFVPATWVRSHWLMVPRKAISQM